MSITNQEKWALPKWAQETSHNGPVEGSYLVYNGRYTVVPLGDDINTHQALTGWGKVMYQLTDDIVRHYRTDMVHDSAAVSDMLRVRAVEGRVKWAMSFLYITRPTGTHLYSFGSFDGPLDMDKTVKASLSGSAEEAVYLVTLEQTMTSFAEAPRVEGQWIWLAEQMVFSSDAYRGISRVASGSNFSKR